MKKLDRVGPYTLLSPLGDGMTGHVWLASTGRGAERRVLKLAAQGDAAARAQLLHEVDMIRPLDHYNIVPVHECGESKGVVWMAMSYVAGPHTPLTLENFRQLLLALVHVHAHGVVHAGINPGHLLLGEEGHLRLISFANARREGGGPMPAAGIAHFMPHFMPPEQLRGEALDLRADLFSAGAVLYQILSGKQPFDATAHQGAHHAALAPGALPSTLVPGLGTCFDQLITKALAPEPADRYANSFAFLGDFDAASHKGARPPP